MTGWWHDYESGTRLKPWRQRTMTTKTKRKPTKPGRGRPAKPGQIKLLISVPQDLAERMREHAESESRTISATWELAARGYLTR